MLFLGTKRKLKCVYIDTNHTHVTHYYFNCQIELGIILNNACVVMHVYAYGVVPKLIAALAPNDVYVTLV